MAVYLVEILATVRTSSLGGKKECYCLVEKRTDFHLHPMMMWDNRRLNIKTVLNLVSLLGMVN